MLRNLTADWVGRFSDSFLAVEHAYNTPSPQPTEIARVRECAKHLIALREGILAQVPLTDKAKRKVRNDVYVAIPFKNPAPKLYSRVGEPRDEFERRCDRVAQDMEAGAARRGYTD